MPTNAEIKALQANIWSSAASAWENWDEKLERLPRPVNDWLCDAVGLTPGMNVLDLASGAGQPAITAAERVAPSGRVTAIDIAPAMVEVLQRRIKSAGISNLEAREMDMETLDFPDQTFDAVTGRWAFMFAPDTVKAMSEARRVLKPGGRLSTATWATADENWWQGAQIFEKTLNPLVPPPPLDPNAPNPLRFSDANLLEQLLKDAGFTSISVERVSFTFDVESSDEWWRFITGINAPVAARLSRLSSAQLAQVREQSITEIERFGSGALSLPAVCLCTVAQK